MQHNQDHRNGSSRPVHSPILGRRAKIGLVAAMNLGLAFGCNSEKEKEIPPPDLSQAQLTRIDDSPRESQEQISAEKPRSNIDIPKDVQRAIEVILEKQALPVSPPPSSQSGTSIKPVEPLTAKEWASLAFVGSLFLAFGLSLRELYRGAKNLAKVRWSLRGITRDWSAFSDEIALDRAQAYVSQNGPPPSAAELDFVGLSRCPQLQTPGCKRFAGRAAGFGIAPAVQVWASGMTSRPTRDGVHFDNPFYVRPMIEIEDPKKALGFLVHVWRHDLRRKNGLASLVNVIAAEVQNSLLEGRWPDIQPDKNRRLWRRIALDFAKKLRSLKQAEAAQGLEALADAAKIGGAEFSKYIYARRELARAASFPFGSEAQLEGALFLTEELSERSKGNARLVKLVKPLLRELIRVTDQTETWQKLAMEQAQDLDSPAHPDFGLQESGFFSGINGHGPAESVPGGKTTAALSLTPVAFSGLARIRTIAARLEAQVGARAS